MKQILTYGVAAGALAVWVCVGCAGLRDLTTCAAASPVGQTELQISDDLRVTELRAGVWLHTSSKTYPDGMRFYSNGLILGDRDETVLVDTAWGVEATAQLLAWVNETLHCPVTMAVITHSHDDRSEGVTALLENGIPVFAESRTVALAAAAGQTNLISLGRLEAGEALVLRRMEVMFPGPGHSPDNVVVWLPTQRTLFGGCLVKSADATTLGNTNDANVVNWPRAIELIRELYGAAEVVLPGHGAAAGPDLLQHTQELLGAIQVEDSQPIPVILDTDIGSDIDDTWALIHLLKSPELDPNLILTATGDTEYRAKIVARFLELAGRTDIPIGVGIRGGSAHEYQKPWVADFDLSDYHGTVHADGVQKLIDIVRASPAPVTIIAIGPTGNIAEALRRDPSIARKARYVGMQGSINVGYGDGPPGAEANVRGNVAGFRTVLKADWLDFTITPLDTCGNVALAGNRYHDVRRSNDPVLKALIQNYRIWAGLVTWIEVDFFESRSSTLFDTVAVFLAYRKDLLELETIRTRITDDGMTVRDPEGIPIDVAIRWKDQSVFLDHLTQRLVDSESADAQRSSGR